MKSVQDVSIDTLYLSEYGRTKRHCSDDTDLGVRQYVYELVPVVSLFLGGYFEHQEWLIL